MKFKFLLRGDEEELAEVISRCVGKEFGMDTETTGLDVLGTDRAQGDVTVGYCIAPRVDEGYYVPFGHSRDRELQMDRDFVISTFKPLLEGDLGGVPCYHNFAFDYPMLRKDGIEAIVGYDSLVSARLVNNAVQTWKSCGLKELMHDIFGVSPLKIGDLFSSSEHLDAEDDAASVVDFESLPLSRSEVAEYAAADACNTLRLCQYMMRVCDSLDDRFDVDFSSIVRLETMLTPVLARMRQRGLLLDVAMCEEKEAEADMVLEKCREAYVRELEEIAGAELVTWSKHKEPRKLPLNLNSSAQLSKVLFSAPPEGIGLPVPNMKGAYKENGEPSTDKRVLSRLAEDYPIVRKLLGYRAIETNSRRYLSKLPGHAAYDGRIHCRLKPLGTETGRFSSSAPNMQNMTRDGVSVDDLPGGMSYSVNIRDVIVAPPGSYFFEADYSQVEYRAMAGESGEQSMIDAFNNDADVHSQTAATVFGVPVSEVDSSLRQRGKTLNFSLLFGQGPSALSEALNISKEEAIGIQSRYYSRQPSIRLWKDKVIQAARSSGVAVTRFGRVRDLSPFYSHPSENIREAGDRRAVNTAIQGACADVLKAAMIRLDRMCEATEGIDMVHTVHDSVLFVVDDSLDPAFVFDLVQSEMCLPVDGWPKLSIDAKFGRRYGSMVEVTRDSVTPDADDSIVERVEEPKGLLPALIVEVPSFTPDSLRNFHSFLLATPGDRPVRLFVGGVPVEVDLCTSVGVESQALRSILGDGASVSIDLDSELDVLSNVRFVA